MSNISRRTVLAAGAGALGAVGAVGLAACGGTDATARSGAVSHGERVAKVTDIPVGQAISATVDSKDVIVSRPTAGTVACFSAICTHEGCIVHADGNKAVCPCHGSVFNALTGQVIQTPAPAPLARVPVTIKNGQVVTT